MSTLFGSDRLMFATGVEEGMRTLKQDGIERMREGVTDIRQVRTVCIE